MTEVLLKTSLDSCIKILVCSWLASPCSGGLWPDIWSYLIVLAHSTESLFINIHILVCKIIVLSESV